MLQAICIKSYHSSYVLRFVTTIEYIKGVIAMTKVIKLENIILYENSFNDKENVVSNIFQKNLLLSRKW